MPNNVRANLELGAQIVIAIAIVVVAGVVVKRYLSPRQVSPASLPRITIGERLNVPNVDWEQNKKTLVFFLMKDCKYCKSSAPFYRQLIEDASKRNVKWLAILPNSVEEGRNYVQSLELPIENVQTGSLSSYKIPGTPSVLFVDNQGIVKSVWFGAEPGREKEMRDELISLFDSKISSEAPATEETSNKVYGTQEPHSTAPARKGLGAVNR
jgi:peroxiredoxin